MSALEIRGLTVRYGEVLALEAVDLDVPDGAAVGLVGVNGSGKSTLFRAAVGLVRPVTGTVRLLDGPPEEARRRGWVGYVPQVGEIDLDFPVTVADVVLMGRYPHARGRPGRDDRRAADAALERVGMGGFAHRPVGRLSGGQRQRVMLARAVAQEARLLLLDEPFTGVDAGSQAALEALLAELVAAGCGVLLSSHDLAAVPRVCSRAVLLQRSVRAAGPTDEVLTAANLAATFGLAGGAA